MVTDAVNFYMIPLDFVLVIFTVVLAESVFRCRLLHTIIDVATSYTRYC